MAKKKVFALNVSLQEALSDTVTAVNHYSGELHIEAIPLRKIELDPENPRQLALQREDIQNEISVDDPLYNKKIQEKTGLTTLAESIKQQGVINPILVYKDEDYYRLIAGERRTLASLLANKIDIPAKILPTKPTPLKLSLLQWVENMEREDLTLGERLKNIEKICTAYARQQQLEINSISTNHLETLLGLSVTQAHQYKCLLSASPRLRKLIDENKIRNIDKASFIARAPSTMEQLLIEACEKGASLEALKKLSNTPSSNEEMSKTKFTRINLGRTTNPKVAKIIMKSILEHDNFKHFAEHFNHIAWDNPASLTVAFKKLINLLETVG